MVKSRNLGSFFPHASSVELAKNHLRAADEFHAARGCPTHVQSRNTRAGLSRAGGLAPGRREHILGLLGRGLRQRHRGGRRGARVLPPQYDHVIVTFPKSMTDASSSPNPPTSSARPRTFSWAYLCGMRAEKLCDTAAEQLTANPSLGISDLHLRTAENVTLRLARAERGDWTGARQLRPMPRRAPRPPAPIALATQHRRAGHQHRPHVQQFLRGQLPPRPAQRYPARACPSRDHHHRGRR